MTVIFINLCKIFVLTKFMKQTSFVSQIIFPLVLFDIQPNLFKSDFVKWNANDFNVALHFLSQNVALHFVSKTEFSFERKKIFRLIFWNITLLYELKKGLNFCGKRLSFHWVIATTKLKMSLYILSEIYFLLSCIKFLH
jgi:hypothetical protein